MLQYRKYPEKLLRGVEMKCPFCGFEESKVIDSRPTDEGSAYVAARVY